MPDKKADPGEAAWDGLDGFHKLLGHRGRLGICVLLARSDQLSFRRLKELLKETDGSLGAQLRKLEDEGFVAVTKEFQDRKPVSWYELTKEGRRKLKSHLNALGRLIKGQEL